MANSRWQLGRVYVLALSIVLLLAVTPFANAQELSGKTLIAAIPGNLPPHYIITPEGLPDGFAIDVMNHVAIQANLRIKYRIMKNWAEAHAALESGEADIIPDMGVTPAREKKFDFTRPFETFSVVLFVRSSTLGINGIDDLSGKRVATVQTNVAIAILNKRPGVKTVVYDKLGSALFALLSGDVDALIYPELWVERAANEAGIEDRIKVVGKPLMEIVRAMAVRKGNTALQKRLDDALRQFRGSPAYRGVYTHWFGKPKSILTVQALKWVLVVAVGLIIVTIIVVVVWRNRSLRSINEQLSKTIEERRQAEISLNEQILRNELILQTTHEGFAVMDLEGNIKDANPAFCEMLGYTYHELLTMSLFDIKVHNSREEVVRFKEQVAQRGNSRFESVHRRKDGTEIDLDVSITLGEINNNRFFFAFCRDITEQKRAQSELRTSEQLWRTVVENVPDFIVMVDRDGQIQFVNRDLPGYPRGQVLATTVFDYQSDDVHSLMKKKLAKVFETGETVSFETLNQATNGSDSKTTYITRIAPIYTNEQVTSALMLSVDVSELRQIEQALRASEERLLSITRHSPDYIFMLDDKGIIQFINRTFPEYSVEQIVGTPLLDYIPAQNRENVRRVLDRVMRTGEQDMFNAEHISEGVGVEYFESYVGPIKKDGKVTALTVSGRNITDRKRIDMAMQALARGADRFEFEDFIRDAVRQLASVYNAKYAFAGLLVQPHKTEVKTLAVWSGDHFEENFIYKLDGTPCQDILNRVKDIIPENAVEEYPDDDQLVRLGVKSYYGAMLISSQGEAIGVLSVMDVKPMKYNASLKNILGVFASRVSVEMDRKRSYEEVNHYREHLEELVSNRTRELERANQELESFCYSVSHDLRSPLRTIDGFSQVVLEDYKDKLDDNGTGYLERVRKATQRMGDLIDDMLSLYSVTRGEFDNNHVDLTLLVNDVVENIRMRSPERSVELEVEPNLKASGDERLIKIAMENLLTNAWKFTGKTERPHIVVGKLANNNNRPTFFVKDNGVGFDMAYANKLFGAFKRLHHEHEFEGTGVGLAIVKRIIDRHNGKVWAESEPGKGTTFYFTFA